MSSSIFSGVSLQSTEYPENPQVVIALEAINLISNIREFDPILLAIENKLKPKMELEVENYGWLKTGGYVNPCATCNMKKGL